jgi:trimeric autotransporter adhesin
VEPALGVISPGPLSVVDPNLKLFYTLMEVYTPGGYAFQIQQFDQTQFQLMRTIIVPNANGIPANFIRWGQSGLAIVTSTTSSSQQGQLYILDGSFVNPSGTPDTTVGNPLIPVPTLTAINPITATAGSNALTLTVTGRDFTGQPTVFWNGSPLLTTLISGAQVSAQVPASDLASVNQAAITASNGTTPSPSSNSLPFSVNPAPASGNQISVYSTGGDDLVWDAKASKIYVSMPGTQGDSGDTIAIVDPVAGTVSNTPFLGSDPDRLSLSSDGQYLYLGLNGENAIQQLALPDFTVNTAWNLGGITSSDGPYYALDLQAAPGSPQTTAVILANFDLGPSSASVAVYDGSTPRSNQLQSGFYSFESLQWANSGASIYDVDQSSPQSFLVLGVSASGVVLDQHYDSLFDNYSNSIHYDPGTGMIYTDQGQVVDPSNGTVVGSFGASGIAAPDSSLNTVYILGQTAAQVGTTSYTIESFNQTTFASIGSIIIDNVIGAPTAFIRWGTNGLAFTTQLGIPIFFSGTGPGQLYVVSGNIVQAAESKVTSGGTKSIPPVRKTWGMKNDRRQRGSPSLVVHRDRLTQ